MTIKCRPILLLHRTKPKPVGAPSKKFEIGATRAPFALRRHSQHTRPSAVRASGFATFLVCFHGVFRLFSVRVSRPRSRILAAMMESPNSEGVVLPDISEAEHLASGHDGDDDGGGGGGDDNGAEGAEEKARVQVQAIRQGVPVSLPVGSLITTNFSVITQDQLQQFKPMLCVDNNG